MQKKKKLTKDFLKLLTADIGTSVNNTVVKMQRIQRRHKKVILPSLEDISCLHKHLKEKRTEKREAYMALQKSFSYSN